jgi:outer membrane protein TolC
MNVARLTQHHRLRPWLLGALLFHSTLTSLPAKAAQAPLTISSYVEQVKTGNQGIQGLRESVEAAEGRAMESSLLTQPHLISQVTQSWDGRLVQGLLTYDRLDTTNLLLGVQQNFKFGLTAKATYSFTRINYINMSAPLFSALGAILSANPATAAMGASLSGTLPVFNFIASPSIELSQALWGGGFGRATRAQQELAEASARSQMLGNRYNLKASLAQAETAYWRLLISRQAIGISEKAVDRTRRILDWATRRAQLNLADRADALQAEAALSLRKLELQSSRDEERAASRAFNALRSIDSDVVKETLDEALLNKIDHAVAPKRVEMRDDVLAAREGLRATTANATLSQEKLLPTLDVFGSLGSTGYKNDALEVMGDSFSSGRVNAALGLRFSTPLAFGLTSDLRSAWTKERLAAEHQLERKIFEQENAWKDLEVRLQETKRRLKIMREVEAIQSEKLENERIRLGKARTVAYQVLLFETDYLVSQLSRIRIQAELLTLISQMKLFGDGNS